LKMVRRVLYLPTLSPSVELTVKSVPATSPGIEKVMLSFGLVKLRALRPPSVALSSMKNGIDPIDWAIPLSP